jgi:hypothetical protein
MTSLLQGNQLDLENEGSVAGNIWGGTLGTVTKKNRNIKKYRDVSMEEVQKMANPHIRQ